MKTKRKKLTEREYKRLFDMAFRTKPIYSLDKLRKECKRMRPIIKKLMK